MRFPFHGNFLVSFTAPDSGPFCTHFIWEQCLWINFYDFDNFQAEVKTLVTNRNMMNSGVCMCMNKNSKEKFSYMFSLYVWTIQKIKQFYYLSSYNFLFKRFNLLKVHVKNLCCPSSESSEGLSREVKLTFFRDIKRKSNLTGNKFDFFLQKSANSNESRESTILNFHDSQCPRFSTLRIVESWESWKLRIVDENRKIMLHLTWN